MDNLTPAAPARNQRAQGSGLPQWLAFMAGGVVTFLFVYIGIARPAADELAKMRRRLSTLEQSVWEVAGHKETALASNQLLGLLAEQKQHLALARETFREMQDLHDAMRRESERVREAMQVAEGLTALKDSLLAGGTRVEEAAKVASQSLALHRQLADSLALVNEARQAGDGLIQLEQSLLGRDPGVDEARSTLSDLFALRDEISIKGTDVTEAQSRVRELVDLKDTILSQTDNLADAVETLELTTELSAQFQQAASAFDRMRLWMVEVVAMEPMLQSARKTLEPLTELGNLKRLNPDQLRQLVRAISQADSSQVAAASEPKNSPSPAMGPAPSVDFHDIDVTFDSELNVKVDEPVHALPPASGLLIN